MNKNYLEIRRFTGATLADAVRYLKVDIPKAFQDAMIILKQPQPVPQIYSSVATAGTIPASSNIFTMTTLSLPAGYWHIFGSCIFDDNGTGQNFSTSSNWITLGGPTSFGGPVPSDAILGYNYARLEPEAGITFDSLTLMSQYYLRLTAPKIVYLEGQAYYAGGAGSPLFNAAMVAHGFVME